MRAGNSVIRSILGFATLVLGLCVVHGGKAQQLETLRFVSAPVLEGFKQLRQARVSLADPTALLAAAEQGNPAAMLFVATGMIHGKDGFARDEKGAAAWAERAAGAGVPDALLVLGEYYAGVLTGTPVRLDLAQSYYERAVAAGYVPAKTNLANLLLARKPSEIQRAIALFREADAAGDRLASAQLGLVYLHGHGVGRDLAAAERLLTKAVAIGHAGAMRGLGQLHLEPGLARDVKQALGWLERAAAAGDPVAPLLLVQGYTAPDARFGDDPSKALLWMRRAEPHFRSNDSRDLNAALRRLREPYLAADRSKYHALGRGFAHEWVDGTVIADDQNIKQVTIARSPSSLRLLLYPCRGETATVDFVRARELTREGRFVDAILELRRGCGTEAPAAWLRDRAREGYAQLAIEYADWIKDRDPAEARRWVGFGYMRIAEDAVLCADPGAVEVGRVLLSRYRDLTQRLSRQSYTDYAAEHASAAAESERLGVAGSPVYACYHTIAANVAYFGAMERGARGVVPPSLIPESDWSRKRADARNAMVESARRRETEDSQESKR